MAYWVGCGISAPVTVVLLLVDYQMSPFGVCIDFICLVLQVCEARSPACQGIQIISICDV